MESGRPSGNMIGDYGQWAASLVGEAPTQYSFRNSAWEELEDWKPKALVRFLDRLALPYIDGTPEAVSQSQYTYDGLHVEELTWQLSYGPPTKA